MKGFIEVEGKYENKGKFLIAVSDIIRVSPTGFKDDQTHIVTKQWGLFTDETYEEIKQKIKDAIEPKLMIDEKGNLKEQK